MTSLLIRLGAIGFFAVQIGCSGDTTPAEEAPVEEKIPTLKFQVQRQVGLNALADAVNKAELVPSPIEMEAKLKSAGLQQNLGSLFRPQRISRSWSMTTIKWRFVPVS